MAIFNTCLFRGVFVGRNLSSRLACFKALKGHHIGRRAMGLSYPWDYYVMRYNRNTGWAVLVNQSHRQDTCRDPECFICWKDREEAALPPPVAVVPQLMEGVE